LKPGAGADLSLPAAARGAGVEEANHAGRLARHFDRGARAFASADREIRPTRKGPFRRGKSAPDRRIADTDGSVGQISRSARARARASVEMTGEE
jgi:hypothetical protein